MAIQELEHNERMNHAIQSPTTSSLPIPRDLLVRIRSENLNVYRASPQRLREDVGQECQIAQDYRGRLIYELLQNADDAMVNGGFSACIRFELTETELWVANSGRALDEADVRGLCGISASKKASHGMDRRASIGHKGMGFKSVLQITDAPEVYSTSICFRFSPEEAVKSVQPLVDDGNLDQVTRAPATRFPWQVDDAVPAWERLRSTGMNTAFCFPLKEKMTIEQKNRLAEVLRNLPITSLVFLKHIGRIEVQINRNDESTIFAWSVRRQHLDGDTWKDVPGFAVSGDYRVTLCPDDGSSEIFILSHDNDIPIGSHRGGIDEFTWENIEYTEVSLAARMAEQQPKSLSDSWRRFHVFLPTGEMCPYDLLVSGAFGSNLSRQEIRVENDENNYNRFLFSQAARVLRDRLIPRLLKEGATVVNCLRLLDRRVNVKSPCTTAAAQAFYEEVAHYLADLEFLPGEREEFFSIGECAVPPLVSDDKVGREFRALLRFDVSPEGRPLPASELCGSAVSRVMVDHGAYMLTPNESASLLASADPARSEIDTYKIKNVFVDPVLSVLEQLWRGLEWQDRDRLVASARREPLFPVAIDDGDTAKRICTQDSTCFYPPRFLHGEVPLKSLCFLMQEICWGDFKPRERNIEMQSQMEAWKALFDIREFKFPEVMRASVLPSLDLERSSDRHSERSALQDIDRLAAICQLAGRTPNANSPLPYERLKANRALFNLSRLDVPCRGVTPDDVAWIPAYRVYFGSDWIGSESVEEILKAGNEFRMHDLPEIYFLLGPNRFTGLLARYQHLKNDWEGDEHSKDIGEDEVSIDEDEEAALDADDHERWLQFFQWLGVNGSLRPVHFHDVEDRASGWLKTSQLHRPDGRVFRNIPDKLWKRFHKNLLKILVENDPTRFRETVPYFYELHDLEHLVAFANAASMEPTAQFAKALYKHLAQHWRHLEKFSSAIVAQVLEGQVPSMRSKPPKAKAEELTEAGPNLWLFRLQEIPFCPTGHGPRGANETWLPTPEVQRRFGRRAKVGSYLIPVLDIDPSLRKGKYRAFSQALGIRNELSPATFSVADAHDLLGRLRELYQKKCESGDDLSVELREVIRPAYRNVVELLSGNTEVEDWQSPLAIAPILVSNGANAFKFLGASDPRVFYLNRRDTRDRLVTDMPIWTFVIEASSAARSVLTRCFGMRVLEEALVWAPKPGDSSLDDEALRMFKAGLHRLAPYILARIGADRADERLARQDAKRLRSFVDAVEPVTHLDLVCYLDNHIIAVSDYSREAFVDLGSDDKMQTFVTWGENPWPPSQQEAEALSGALCDVLGAGYFEPFLTLIQAESPDLRERILRRAGAPLDVDEKFALFNDTGGGISEDDEGGTSKPEDDEPKTVLSEITLEEPAETLTSKSGNDDGKQMPQAPLYKHSDLLVDGVPLVIEGDISNTLKSNGKPQRHQGASRSGRRGNCGYGGNTDLDKLNTLGMWVSIIFEQNRLRRSGLKEASIFETFGPSKQYQAQIFDVSTPEAVEYARRKSNRLNNVLIWLQQFGVVPDWPGFDILTLDNRVPNGVDRMIELKSSGVASRLQEMTWNEWKTAKNSALRTSFYLYLVGNLRSDLAAAQPYIRTIRNPFDQMCAEVSVTRAIQKKIQLSVNEFREAEHLELIVRQP
jgi:Protein NO VEIN, C-terminal